MEATNGAGPPLSNLASSAPILIDVTPPIPGEVWDSIDCKPRGYTSEGGQLQACWEPFTELESEIVEYRYVEDQGRNSAPKRESNARPPALLAPRPVRSIPLLLGAHRYQPCLCRAP